ncbi:MAG: adenylate/guanylate cyclase domain-containing protein [Deltaproteobacteria bacterium]|nr:MAG: adenylate/guanylate cyclase domain-containing protein [Deltaproteobacteria bacterium]
MKHPLLPSWIVQKHLQGDKRGLFQAVTLFVDLSGFTALTETLMAHGKQGAETLAEALRFYFDPTVHVIHEQGGVIVGFAGDAFTAVFPCDEEGSAPQHAWEAAIALQSFFAKHATYKTSYGEFLFAAKIGLAWGDVLWEILPLSVERRTYCFRGPAILGCADAQALAGQGDIVLERALVELLPESLEGVEHEGYLQVPAELLQTNRWAPAELDVDPATIVKDTEDVSADILGRFVPDEILHFPLRGEWRKVTVVFLAFEKVDELTDLATLLSALLEEYGGTFTRFDFGDKSDNVLLFFGAPTSHERDLQRALDFLLALQQRSEPTWALRAGVTQNMMYVGFNGGQQRHEFTCLGRGVNMAARLMMKAPWGEFWCGPAVYTKASHRYAFAEREPQLLKGFPVPLLMHALQHRLTNSYLAHSSTTMVGRERQMKLMHKSISPLFYGESARLLFIDGEPGAGKSLLVDSYHHHLEELYANQPFLWLYCPCDAILQQSFSPFSYALRHYTKQLPTQTLEQNRSVFDTTWSHLQQRLSESLGGEDPERLEELQRVHSIVAALVGLHWKDSLYFQLEPKARFENTLQALQAWLLAESSLQPVILHVGDAQWLDADSIEALQSILKHLADAPIAVILTSRYQNDGSPFRLPFPSSMPQTLLPLGPLSKRHLQDMARSLLGREMAPSLLELVHSKSEGNPFFAEQILRYLQDNRRLQHTDDGVEALESEMMLSEDVHALLVARLDQLDIDKKRTVQAASVLGQEFVSTVLTSLLEHPTHLAQTLHAIAHEHVWSSKDSLRYNFRHALLRDAAYHMQSEHRLRELHAAATEAYEQVFSENLAPHYGELALHSERAGLIEKAAFYLEKAGDEAKHSFLNLSAASYYEKALAYHGTTRGAAIRRIALSAAEVLTSLSRWKDVLAVCDLAAQAMEEPSAAVCLARATVLVKMSNYDDAGVEAAQAQILAHRYQQPVIRWKAYKMQGQVAWYCGDLKAAHKLFEQSLDIARSIDDDEGVAGGLNNLGIIAWREGRLEEAKQLLEDSLRRSEASGNLSAKANIVGNLANVARDSNDSEESHRLAMESMGLFRQLGDREREATLWNNIAINKMSQQQYVFAYECFGKAHRLFSSLEIDAPRMRVHQAEALRCMGKLEEAEEHILQAEDWLETCENPLYAADGYVVYGHLLRDRGKPKAARALYLVAQEKANESAVPRALKRTAEALHALENELPTPMLYTTAIAKS